MAANPAAKKRRYQVAWEHLKKHGKIKIEVTRSTDPSVFTKNVRTMRKAIQKEKYQDDSFRLQYPDAQITSTTDPEAHTIAFVMNLNVICSLSDLDSVPVTPQGLGDL